MGKLRTAVLAGAAMLSLAGAAMAAINDAHVMRVNLPDGSVARIEYKGDVAPNVRIDRSTPFEPIYFAGPFDAGPLEMFERVSADMDRQFAALLHQAQTPASKVDSRSPDAAMIGSLPAGTMSYRFVSTSDGNHECSRSWQLTSQGSDQQPKLISATSGDCGGDVATKAPAAAGASARPIATPRSPHAAAI